MKKQQPIRLGDKFLANDETWELIERKPGGKIVLFNKEKTIFLPCRQRDLRSWGWERMESEGHSDHGGA